MNNFRHFIITRFNIPLGNAYSTDKSGCAIDEGWLKDRVLLFEKYCFPSIRNQVCNDFYWLGFFDKESPLFLMDKISRWKSECSQLVPICVTDYDEFKKVLMTAVVENSVGYDYVITTRLDNDDALLPDAVRKIQKNFIPQHKTIIDIEDGYCYDATKNVLYLMKENKSNQFISLIEERSLVETVFRHNHRHWIRVANLITVKVPLWIEVVHERNLYNSRGGVALLKKADAVNYLSLKISFVNSLMYRVRDECVDFVKYIKKMLNRNS
mgnify:CR=1 FL=1